MIPDKAFNSLIWGEADGAGLNGLLSGCLICGAEPIDYPLTDGCILYIECRSGERIALNIGQEPDDEGGFYIRAAKIPDGVALYQQATDCAGHNPISGGAPETLA